MNDTDPDKNPDDKPWFGPKKFGIGIRPNSWQGWLVLALALIAEVVIASVAPQLYPSWFAPKEIGTGFTPATWQGWAVTLLPVLIFIALVFYIYNKQRKR